MEITPVARIFTDFPTKFAVPRQSGLVEGTPAVIVMEKPFRNPDAFKEIASFSHLWLIWEFSENRREQWSPTVRPPRLGGNSRVGVFASRSPFRPNALGLSCVRLEKFVPSSADGPLLYVRGADIVNGTPIYDIKPYLPFTDSHPDALSGYAGAVYDKKLEVKVAASCQTGSPFQTPALMPGEKWQELKALLAQDPRPSYQDDPQRVYGFPFAGWEVRFRVEDGVLWVLQVEKRKASPKARYAENF